MPTKRIGEFLVEKGILSLAEVDQILNYSRKNGLRFGEAALELGFLTPEKLIRVLGPDYRINFFYLHPDRFPKDTLKLFTVDEVLRYGVLPLGFKKKFRWFRRPTELLNIGLLNPGNPKRLDELDEIVRSRIKGDKYQRIQVFLILADQFLGVLRSVYGLKVEDLESKPESELDPTLTLFLQKE